MGVYFLLSAAHVPLTACSASSMEEAFTIFKSIPPYSKGFFACCSMEFLETSDAMYARLFTKQTIFAFFEMLFSSSHVSVEEKKKWVPEGWVLREPRNDRLEFWRSVDGWSTQTATVTFIEKERTYWAVVGAPFGSTKAYQEACASIDAYMTTLPRPR